MRTFVSALIVGVAVAFAWLLPQDAGSNFRETGSFGQSDTLPPGLVSTDLGTQSGGRIVGAYSESNTQPDLILATAHVIRDNHASLGREVEVRVDAFVAYNGRPNARLVDPQVDLAKESQAITKKDWIVPAP